MHYGEYIKGLCKDKGIPVSKLEKDLGFGNGYIATLSDRISNKRAKLIADYFAIPVDSFYNEEKKRPVTKTDLLRETIMFNASRCSDEELEKILDYIEFVVSKR